MKPYLEKMEKIKFRSRKKPAENEREYEEGPLPGGGGGESL